MVDIAGVARAGEDDVAFCQRLVGRSGRGRRAGLLVLRTAGPGPRQGPLRLPQASGHAGGRRGPPRRPQPRGDAVTLTFQRVLVANRGEIALRIIRACRELGLESVAVYSDADAQAAHVAAADQAVRLGPAPAGESYLRADLLVEAALATGAQAIHPGYGFLSERAAFAEACAAAGLIFVGPAPATLAGLGDKLAARRSARAAGVPVVPGTLDAARFDAPADRAALLAAAEDIGWPLLVKAAAGGGGRGMRRVERAADLPGALAAAAGEAAAAFGDGAVYLERLIEGARHIEVQLLGDQGGQVVALGERDCSVQRRHQKLLEEAPAPGLTTAERTHLAELAVLVARAVGLRGAATCEFLRTAEGAVWFLEVNARLQVEHGVTELLTGLDLVHEQFRIASGAPLSARVLEAAARATVPAGHAIEVRLSAEDPGADFAPQPGRLTAWHEPGGPGVRIDGWVTAETVVPPDYDPLLAKLLVLAEDRPAALARLRRALDEFEIGGLQTSLPFHRWLVGQADFQAGGVDIDFVAGHWDGAGPARRGGGRGPARGPRPASSDGRCGRPGRRCLRRDAARPVGPGGPPGCGGDVAPLSQSMRATLAATRSSCSSAPRRRRAPRQRRPPRPWPSRPRPSAALPAGAGRAGRRSAPGRGRGRRLALRGPRGGCRPGRPPRAGQPRRRHRGRHGHGSSCGPQIPGRVVSVRVQDGESVEAGQRLLSVEAMKMENEIRAQRAGRVERVAVEPGQRVERGDELAVLA